MKRITFTILLGLIFMASTLAQKFEVDTISKTGDLDDRINLVFLADGYQENELDKFIDDVKWMMDEIFQKDPYPAYRNYFNAFAVKVPSEESGAANDPDSLINNYFGSTFNWANIWRLVVPAHSGKVQSVLRDNLPAYDQVIVIVNDSRYGGSGGWMATNTTHTNGPEICIHEMGHSFAGMSDEYWAGSGYARENTNMTQESNPDEVRWNRWVGTKATGVYAHSENTSWFRPHQNCEMRYLNREFCPICQEEHASKILDLTSPVIHFSPEETAFTNTESTLKFKVDLLEPTPNTLKTIWVLNSDSIAGNVDSLHLEATELLEGNNRLFVSILDTTNFIRKSSHSRVHKNTISWDIDAGSSGIIQNPTKSKFNADIYPNPAADFITIDYQLSEQTTISFELVSLEGKIHQLTKSSQNFPGNHTVKFDLTKFNLPPSTYYLLIRTNSETTKLPITIL